MHYHPEIRQLLAQRSPRRHRAKPRAMRREAEKEAAKGEDVLLKLYRFRDHGTGAYQDKLQQRT